MHGDYFNEVLFNLSNTHFFLVVVGINKLKQYQQLFIYNYTVTCFFNIYLEALSFFLSALSALNDNEYVQ